MKKRRDLEAKQVAILLAHINWLCRPSRQYGNFKHGNSAEKAAKRFGRYHPAPCQDGTEVHRARTSGSRGQCFVKEKDVTLDTAFRVRNDLT